MSSLSYACMIGCLHHFQCAGEQLHMTLCASQFCLRNFAFFILATEGLGMARRRLCSHRLGRPGETAFSVGCLGRMADVRRLAFRCAGFLGSLAHELYSKRTSNPWHSSASGGMHDTLGGRQGLMSTTQGCISLRCCRESMLPLQHITLHSMRDTRGQVCAPITLHSMRDTRGQVCAPMHACEHARMHAWVRACVHVRTGACAAHSAPHSAPLCFHSQDGFCVIF